MSVGVDEEFGKWRAFLVHIQKGHIPIQHVKCISCIYKENSFITGILVYHSHCMDSCFTVAEPLQPLECHLQWWQESLCPECNVPLPQSELASHLGICSRQLICRQQRLSNHMGLRMRSRSVCTGRRRPHKALRRLAKRRTEASPPLCINA